MAVAVYRLEGGGHTWPGSPHPLPSVLMGRTAGLDATGLLLDMVTCMG